MFLSAGLSMNASSTRAPALDCLGLMPLSYTMYSFFPFFADSLPRMFGPFLKSFCRAAGSTRAGGRVREDPTETAEQEGRGGAGGAREGGRPRSRGEDEGRARAATREHRCYARTLEVEMAQMGLDFILRFFPACRGFQRSRGGAERKGR